MVAVIVLGILVIAGFVGLGFYLGYNTGMFDGYGEGHRDGSLGYPKKMKEE